VRVAVGVIVGMPVPTGVSDPVGVTDGVEVVLGDGMAVVVAVGEATTAVKKAAEGMVQV